MASVFFRIDHVPLNIQIGIPESSHLFQTSLIVDCYELLGVCFLQCLKEVEKKWKTFKIRPTPFSPLILFWKELLRFVVM